MSFNRGESAVVPNRSMSPLSFRRREDQGGQDSPRRGQEQRRFSPSPAYRGAARRSPDGRSGSGGRKGSGMSGKGKGKQDGKKGNRWSREPYR